MLTKTVYSFDPITLRYLGALVLSEANGDLSPLETGVWQIPGNCLEDAPPDMLDGFEAFADGNVWAVRQVLEESANEAKFAEPETAAEKVAAAIDSLNLVVAEYLHVSAQSLKYSSIDIGISYAEEAAVPKFYGEGRALRRLRSLVEASFFERIASLVKYSDGDDEILLSLLPTAAELIDALPKLDMERMQSDIEAAQASLDAQAAASAAEVATAPNAPTEVAEVAEVATESAVATPDATKTAKRTTRKKAS